MSEMRVVLVGVAAFVLGVAILACSEDASRPPATSSGGSATGTSSGGPSSSSGGSLDGSTTDGSSSSGTSSGLVETGLRATVDGTAVEYDAAPTAVRQSSGYVIELTGKDVPGNELKITMKSDALVAVGAYDCTGGQGAKYGIVSYRPAGSAETWDALANGACKITVQEIDNQPNGVTVGTFSGTLQKPGSADKNITGGQFRLRF